MALPLAYGRIVEIYGQSYVDGGLSASIPIQAALDKDVEEILVVLTQPDGYAKRPSRAARLTARVAYPRYPELWPTFEKRASHYNDTVDQIRELEAAGRLTVIRPDSELPASRMTRRRDLILETIQVGRDSARQYLDDLTSR
jgi:predicted patatin/cPLA2 family phospholipase